MDVLAEPFASSTAGYITGIFAIPTLLGVIAIARAMFRTANVLRALEKQQTDDRRDRQALSGRVDSLAFTVQNVSESVAIMRDRFERGSYPNSRPRPPN